MASGKVAVGASPTLTGSLRAEEGRYRVFGPCPCRATTPSVTHVESMRCAERRDRSGKRTSNSLKEEPLGCFSSALSTRSGVALAAIWRDPRIDWRDFGAILARFQGAGAINGIAPSSVEAQQAGPRHLSKGSGSFHRQQAPTLLRLVDVDLQ